MYGRIPEKNQSRGWGQVGLCIRCKLHLSTSWLRVRPGTRERTSDSTDDPRRNVPLARQQARISCSPLSTFSDAYEGSARACAPDSARPPRTRTKRERCRDDVRRVKRR
ncbi:unnamed protein product [Danaus chrysippus]|uniref:(African queen) hypothetical protein n=1 Tax=Danaus chrysippus TaxID=151541 RepID=A0A8J2QZ24_9NEOP|nr:unnamed protein product [Danaus chrysippus]